jgi:CubicO group peptidase (beta-lactamase class C family)
MSKLLVSNIGGYVKPGFETVREAFLENFEHRHEIGAACCIYYQGEKVVDLWGGVRHKESGEPWEEGTMALIYSATKGMSALTMALANSQGLFDYDEKVCTYWPEFARNGKENITVRQLFAHQAGLFAFDEPVDKNVIADLDRLAEVLARQTPAWEPGSRQAYHALTLGFYQGELLRRVDPRHRSLGRFFREELAAPLGLDFYIGLPEEIPNSRLATLQMANMFMGIFHNPLRLTLSAMSKNSPIFRALVVNPGTGFMQDPARIYTRNIEVPSGNGVGTARALAKAYGVFATGGRELGLREETFRELIAPARPAAHGFFDECLKLDVKYSLGFMRPDIKAPFGFPSAFGAPGAGGSMAFADPEVGLGYAYIPNRLGTHLEDPRDTALSRAFYRSIGKTPAF